MGFRACGYNVDKLADKLGVEKGKLADAMQQARVGGLCRVWASEDKGKFSTVRVSASHRSQTSDGAYEQDFSNGFVAFIGAAHDKIKEMSIGKSGVAIIIKSCDVENNYDKEKKTTYTNYKVFDFDVAESNASAGSNSSASTSNKKQTKASSATTQTSDDEELPF